MVTTKAFEEKLERLENIRRDKFGRIMEGENVFEQERSFKAKKLFGH